MLTSNHVTCSLQAWKAGSMLLQVDARTVRRSKRARVSIANFAGWYIFYLSARSYRCALILQIVYIIGGHIYIYQNSHMEGVYAAERDHGACKIRI